MSNPVSESIRKLRAQHDLTQRELAKMSGIPRATLANMETNIANPSIMAVVKVASALGVTVESLIQNTSHNYATVVPRENMQVTRLNNGKFISTLLSPLNAPYIHMSEVTILPDCNTRGKPHPKGSQEFFYCLEGTVHLDIQGDEVEVAAGELLYFPGNLPHDYINRGRKPVHAVSVVTIPK